MKDHPKLTSSLATSSFSHCALILAAGLISSTLACESTSGPEIEQRRVIEQLTPADVEATASSTVVPSPAIRVTDKRTGRPLAGVAVEFRAGAGSGSVEKPFSTTDASGFATAGKWQVGTRSGVFTLTVTASLQGAGASFKVRIKPDVPARFNRLDTTIVGLAGEVVDGPRVVVVDRFGNPTPGIPVTFSIDAGGGALEKSTGVTDFGGLATPGPWRLGRTPGENVLIAAADGIESVRFSAQAVDPASIVRYTLDSVQHASGLSSSPQDAGISGSTLAITAFDRCLCRSGDGYYIMNIGYVYQLTVEPTRIAGQYTIEPPLLRLDGREIKIVVADNGRISMVIERDDGDWTWQETWIFRAYDTSR